MYPHNLHTGRSCPDFVCRRLQKGRQLIEVILLKDELLHDIDTDTLNIEKARKTDGTPVATDERRRYEACRQIDRALNHAVRTMSAYLLLPSPFVHRISTNHAGDWEEKSVYLAMPHNWPPHLIDLVRDSVHNYIVKSAEAEMLTPILSPSDSYVQYCRQDAEASDSELNAAINERLGITDLVQTPFG